MYRSESLPYVGQVLAIELVDALHSFASNCLKKGNVYQLILSSCPRKTCQTSRIKPPYLQSRGVSNSAECIGIVQLQSSSCSCKASQVLWREVGRRLTCTTTSCLEEHLASELKPCPCPQRVLDFIRLQLHHLVLEQLPNGKHALLMQISRCSK